MTIPVTDLGSHPSSAPPSSLRGGRLLADVGMDECSLSAVGSNPQRAYSLLPVFVHHNVHQISRNCNGKRTHNSQGGSGFAVTCTRSTAM